MRRSVSFLTIASLLLGVSASAFADDGKYVRFQQNQENFKSGALQTAVAHFKHPTKDLEIVLYGVVHIADADYYRAVQRDLDSYTVVLYEGVAPGKTKPNAEDKSLFELQKLMGEALGMTFQKDGIDYKRKNLVHADMTIDELKKALGGKSINPMGGVISPDQMKSMAPMMKTIGQGLKMFMKSMPGMQDQLKLMLAKQLGNADLNTALPGKMGKVILIDRNKVALKVLERQLQTTQKGSIAIFYGAAHNPDFQERLEKQGYTMTSKRWMTAWKIGKGIPGDSTQLPGAETPDKRPVTGPKKAKKSGAKWF